MMIKYLVKSMIECFWYSVFMVSVFWILFVSYASGIVIKEKLNKEIKEQYTLTYYNNRIYIDNVKTEYTLKEVSNGVYVIRKGR